MQKPKLLKHRHLHYWWFHPSSPWFIENLVEFTLSTLPSPHSSKKVKDPTCSLHRWATDDNSFKKQGNIMRCNRCNINLWIDCFPLIHIAQDVKKLKAQTGKKNNHIEKKNDIPACDSAFKMRVSGAVTRLQRKDLTCYDRTVVKK